MNIPCLIGSVLGCAYGGWCSDKFLLAMARRKGGIMEAEDRLWLMLLCMGVFPAGMLLFGIGSARGWDWPIPYVGLGFIGFGYGCAGDLSITYLADSYPDMVLEGMVGVAVINNSLALVFAFALVMVAVPVAFVLAQLRQRRRPEHRLLDRGRDLELAATQRRNADHDVGGRAPGQRRQVPL